MKKIVQLLFICIMILSIIGCVQPGSSGPGSMAAAAVVDYLFSNPTEKPRFPMDFEVNSVYPFIQLSSAGDWTLDNTDSNSGVNSFKTKDLLNGEDAGFSFIKEIDELAVLEFAVRIGSSGATDRLYTIVNGSTKLILDTASGWAVHNVNLFPGDNQFKWLFTKSGAEAGDFAMVDDITVKPRKPLIVNDGNDVIITCDTSSAVIYYTTDGSEPDASSSKLYTGSFSAAYGTTVKAKAYKSGWSASDTKTRIIAPPISFPAGFEDGLVYGDTYSTGDAEWDIDTTDTNTGTYSLKTGDIYNGDSVSYNFDQDFDDNGVISYYNKVVGWNGVVSFFNNNSYLGEMWSSTGWENSTYEFLTGSNSFRFTYNKYTDSTAEYALIDDIEIKSRRPVISYDGSDVTISCGTSSALVYYTTDGSDPDQTSSLYGGSFAASIGTDVRAVAYKSGWSASVIAQKITAPVISYPAGFEDGLIYDDIAFEGDGVWEIYTLDTNTGTYSVKTSDSIGSGDETSLYYTDSFDDNGVLSFYSKISGGSGNCRFYINNSQQESWWGSTAWENRTYDFTSGECTFKWRYLKYINNATDYALIDDIDIIAHNPAISYDGADISITCDTGSAAVYYTTDGSDPDQTSTLYVNPFSVALGTEVRARAYKSGWTPSLITSTIAAPAISFPAGFEDGAVYNDIAFEDEGNWIIDTASVNTGTYSIKSSVITHSEEATFKFTKEIAADSTIYFYARISSEENFDYLLFYIDNVLQNSWSGAVAWTQYSFPVTAGTHEFKWRYDKDGSVSNGSDCAWVDDITITTP